MNPSRLQLEKLKQFKKYVLRWNSTHNLVSKSQETNLDEHINDSLSIEACLGKNLIDLGAGGGFPGIPIAIVSPNKRIFLIERSQKKASFLLHTTNKLKLANTKVLEAEVESLLPGSFPQPYEIITRAFGTTKKTIEATKTLMAAPHTKLRMMKTAPFVDYGLIPGQLKTTEILYPETKEKDKRRILVTIEKKENAYHSNCQSKRRSGQNNNRH